MEKLNQTKNSGKLFSIFLLLKKFALEIKLKFFFKLKRKVKEAFRPKNLKTKLINAKDEFKHIGSSLSNTITSQNMYPKMNDP